MNIRKLGIVLLSLCVIMALATTAAVLADENGEFKDYAEGSAGSANTVYGNGTNTVRSVPEGENGSTGKLISSDAQASTDKLEAAGSGGYYSLQNDNLGGPDYKIERPYAEGEASIYSQPEGSIVLSDLLVRYRFSGVTDDGEQGSANRKEATSIHCTNTGSTNNAVEVIVYQWNGTDIFTGTVNMPPMRTFTFSTQNTTIYFDDVLLGGSPGTDAIFQGSGVILSEHPSVVCTVEVLDPLGYPPVFVSAVELFKP